MDIKPEISILINRSAAWNSKEVCLTPKNDLFLNNDNNSNKIIA